MRTICVFGIVAFVSLSSIGCGDGGKANAEKLLKQLVSDMNTLITKFESGDKDGINSALTKIETLFNEMKGVKVSKKVNDELKTKVTAEMTALKPRMDEAIQKALASRKFSPQDLQQFADRMRSFGK